MRKIAIYCRVSTEEQAQVEEGSIKNQVATLEKYIQAENLKNGDRWGVLVEIYKDEGYSAKDLNRPAVKRLLNDINRSKIDTVIITEISCLSRSIRDWIDLRSFFLEKQTSFIASRQNFDTSNAMGRAMLNFAIEFSQLEREMTAERVKASYQARAGRGLWTGGILPYGLERTERNGHLRVNSVEQIIANDLADLLIKNSGSVARTVDQINELGHLRSDGSRWNEKSFANWIKSRTLIGEIEINAVNIEKDQSKLPEADRYKTVKAVWEPVINREKWEQANALLDANYQSLKMGS